jgi:c-di-GMP-binding flagellar brake protein YcgR
LPALRAVRSAFHPSAPPTVTQTHTNPRRFIRHTADVPIEVRAVPGAPPMEQVGVNVSEGGLAFLSDACLDPEQTIEVRISEVDPPFEAHAKVVWCREDPGGYLVGVQFLDANDAFRARMVEQVCTIEKYREQVREQEGRELDTQEAAAEWITKFAGRFPEAGPG